MIFENFFKKSTAEVPPTLDKDYLLNRSKHFCMLPWTSLQIRPDGNVFPCCVSDESGCLGNAKKTSIDGIWNAKKMKEIRSKMLKDKAVSECSYCYQLEKTTEGSFRKHYNKEFSKHYDQMVTQTQVDGTVEQAKLVYWDFRLSNFCNFKCRSCSHLSSSSWHEDTLKLYGGSTLPNAIERVVDYRPQIVDELLQHLSHVEEIYFAGGEPLIMEEHYQILDALLAAGRTDVKIWYNTNFSTLKWKHKDVVELWKQFKDVRVQASLDGSHARGEYIRKGQKWARTVANRERMLKDCPHVQFQISATTSVYNAWHMPDFYKEWLELGFIGHDDFSFNPLFGPNYMRVQLLPRKFREEIAEKYERICQEAVTTNTMRQRFKNAASWILSGDDPHLIGEFKKMTKRMDRLRNEDFSKTFPELRFLMDL